MQVRHPPELADAQLPVVEYRRQARLDEVHEVGVGGLEVVDDGAALNLVPGVVALRPQRTEELYGFPIDGPALALAMRHRAVLLALVGVLLAIAAFDDAWLRPSLLVAVVSKVSFLALFAMTRPHAAPMRRVAIADVAALAVLALAVALHTG